ncbi:hypothetical protein D3C85_1022370 [compost metagenome]
MALVVADGDGRGEFDEDFLADGARFVLQAFALGQALEDDHEFVAADPGDGVGAVQNALEPRGGRDQHAVAGRMTIAVVDGLEAIEIDKHQRHPRGAGARLLQRFGQALFEHQAIGQAGQRVVMGQVLEVVGRGLFFGDVAYHAHHLDRFVVVVLDHVAGFPQPADRSVGPHHAVFLIMVFAGFQATQFAGPNPEPVFRMHAGTEQGVRGRHFADLEAEHAENGI